MAYTFYRISYHHKYIDDILPDIQRYADPSASVMICMETSKNKHTHKKTNGQHYHICVENPFDWKNYRNTILVNKYKLVGKSTKDQPSEYCLSHKIKDEDRFKVYMVKDKNINNIYHNIDLKTIQDYISRSFEKEDPRSFNDALMEHLRSCDFVHPPDINRSTPYLSVQAIEHSIIEYIAEQGAKTQMSCTRSRVTSYATQFLMYHYTPPYHYENGHIVEDFNFSLTRYHYIMNGLKNY